MVMCEPVFGWFFWFLYVYGINSIANAITCSVTSDYKNLCRPWYSPPSWVFPVAWLINFCLLATGSFLVWLDGGGFSAGHTWQLIYFMVHIILLPIWSILFWYYKFRFISFVWILIIILVGIGNAIIFSLLHLASGLVLIPYIIWLMFAALLNFYIWRYNERTPYNVVYSSINCGKCGNVMNAPHVQATTFKNNIPHKKSFNCNSPQLSPFNQTQPLQPSSTHNIPHPLQQQYLQTNIHDANVYKSSLRVNSGDPSVCNIGNDQNKKEFKMV